MTQAPWKIGTKTASRSHLRSLIQEKTSRQGWGTGLTEIKEWLETVARVLGNNSPVGFSRMLA